MTKNKALATSLVCLMAWQGVLVEANETSRRKAQRHAAKERERQKAEEAQVVQLNAGDIASDARMPLQMLSDALKQDQTSEKFRISWYVAVLSLRTSGTALYDRKAKTVKFYESGGRMGGLIYNHILFTGVTDDILFTTLEKYNRNSSDAGFKELPKLGCGQKKLR